MASLVPCAVIDTSSQTSEDKEVEDTESVLKPGYALDRYELLCPLATGGMATVWLARMRGKRGFEKLLAIKTIRAELSDDPRFEEMFLDEARIASGIQHPNVAQILDLGEKEGVLYLVMEWVDGESLARVRKFAKKAGAKVPLGVALRVMADACAGLHAAHELKDDKGEVLGVVHRDVSPQNLLIATSGTVKVIDFGIAKAENRAAPTTRTGTVKGKLQYMAPEQARGGKAVDRRVDLWALGVCLYELVTERLPFDGDNQLEILTKVTSDDPMPPVDDAPPCVREILARSVARKPEDRFATAAAMRRAIENAILELELPSGNEDVAAFVDTHLPDRGVKRKEIVARALKEALLRADAPVDAYTGTLQVALPGSSGPVRAAEAKTYAASPAGKSAAKRISAREILESSPLESSNATLDSAALVGNAGLPSGGGGKWVATLLFAAVIGGGAYAWQRYGRAMTGNATTPVELATAAHPSDDSAAAIATNAGAPPSASLPAPLESARFNPIVSADAGAAVQPAGALPPPLLGRPARKRLAWPSASSRASSAPAGTPPDASMAEPQDPEGENPY